MSEYRFKWDNGFVNVYGSLSSPTFTRPYATVSPAGSSCASGAPRYCAKRQLCGLPTPTTVSS